MNQRPDLPALPKDLLRYVIWEEVSRSFLEEWLRNWTPTDRVVRFDPIVLEWGAWERDTGDDDIPSLRDDATTWERGDDDDIPRLGEISAAAAPAA
jgi:hypothetical protein